MLLLAILAVGTGFAQDSASTVRPAAGPLGVGLVVGDPTGVSLGYRPNEWNAAEVGLGYDALDGGLKGTADYLRTLAVIDSDAPFRVPIYVGIGAGVGRYRDEAGPAGPIRSALDTPADDVGTDISARVPVGASMLFTEMPIEVFAHAIPSLRVLPDRKLDIDGALGVRYYF